MASRTQALAQATAAVPGGPALLRWAAGATDTTRAPIFMLHRVLPDPGDCYDAEMVVSVAHLEQFLGWVRTIYEIVPLPALLPGLQTRPRRPRCALTFDDGWCDTFTHAFPLLERYQAPATVFLALDFIGSQRRFWQERLHRALQQLPPGEAGLERLQRVAEPLAWCPPLRAELTFAALRRQLVRRSSAEAEAFVARLEQQLQLGPASERAFMNWDEVRQMHAAGIGFGSHTRQHTLLSWQPPAEAARELAQSRHLLEQQLGAPVTTLSYPWGGLSPFTRAQAEAAGYTVAVTTQPGLAQAGSDRLLLPRIALSDAQLGMAAAERSCSPGGADGRAFSPATLQLHLFRAGARARRPRRPAVGALTRLRIGILVDNPEAWGYPPEGNLGGSELQLLRLIEALDPDYFQPELYFLRPPASGLPTGLAWPVFGPATAPRGRFATIAALRRRLLAQRPHLVQSMFVDSTFLGVAAAWLAGVPAILCARRNAGYWKRWHHRQGLRVINRLATAWQVNAGLIADMLEREEGVAPAAIEIVPNWIDLQRFHPSSVGEREAARCALALPADSLVVVCVANYSPVKDLGLLVEAAARLRTDWPGLRVVLVGEGSERRGLEAAIAARGVSEQVRLAGESDQVPTYLAAADIGVLASRSEGCSNAVLEYMAAGLPTVLSAIAANRVLSREGLFPPGDASRLAEEIAQLGRDGQERARRGAANRQRAEQYGGEAFAARVQGHYLRVHAARRRG